MKKYLAILLAVLMVTVSGCGDSGSEDASFQKVLDSGKLVLGLDDNFPPMGFRDEAGEIVGFDIDMAGEVCDRLGVELVTQLIDWNEKEDELNTGNIDCIWNGMSWSSSRAESMLLSEPYIRQELILIVRKDSPIKSRRELKGRKIGGELGSTVEDLFESDEFFKDTDTVMYTDILNMIEDLEDGSLDAVALDSIVAYYYIAANNLDLFVLPGNCGEEDFVIGFRKEDNALRDKVQEIIEEMKEDGTMSSISMKWFGADITL